MYELILKYMIIILIDLKAGDSLNRDLE